MKAELNQILENFNYSFEAEDKLPWQRIPVEIWVKIFDYFGKLISSQPKPLTKLRLVCKLWRDVIDENLDFHVKLSDTVLDECTLRHLRVKYLFVCNLRMSLLSNKLVFQDPTLITCLSLNNKISKENFIYLIDQFPNVNNLKINSSFLSSETNLFVPTGSREGSIFNPFWKSIKELNFIYDCTDATNANCWTNNFTKLMKLKMPNLKVFTFNAPVRLIESHLPILFLLQNPSIMDIDFRYCAECRHKYLLPNLQVLKKIKIYDFKRIQLRSIKLKTIRLYEYGHQAWLPIIKAQKSLVKLEISQYGSSFLSGNFVTLDELGSTIMANCSTLTSLKLENFHFSENFDVDIFKSLINLQSLELYLPQNDSCKAISYSKKLDHLPVSLKKLVLKNVSLDNEDLQKILSVDYLINLKYLMISDIENSLEISELVKVLSKKKSLQMLTLSPVVLDYFRLVSVEKGKHYCVVIDNNCRHLGKYFWLSRRLELNCRALRKNI